MHKYCARRTQTMEIRPTISSKETIASGDLHGSVLDPPLLLSAYKSNVCRWKPFCLCDSNTLGFRINGGRDAYFFVIFAATPPPPLSAA